MELQEKLSNFGYYIENDLHCYIQSLKVSPETPFYWKLLIIGIVSAKRIRKILPVLQVGGHAPVPPTPQVFRVIFLHTEGTGKDNCPDCVFSKCRIYSSLKHHNSFSF